MKLKHVLLAVCFVLSGWSAVTASDVDQKDNLISVLTKTGKCKTFLKLVDISLMTGMLRGEGPYLLVTVFAPTDEAFKKMDPQILEDMMKDAGESRKFVFAHYVIGKASYKALVEISTLEVIDKQLDAELRPLKSFAIKMENGQLYIGNVRIVQQDLEGRHGTSHLIDSVLYPK